MSLFRHIRNGLRLLGQFISAPRNEKFQFEGYEFTKLVAWYNRTWRNERAFEVPIFARIIELAYRDNKEILEIGNVLSHYLPTSHCIIDKYEKRTNKADVHNIDIAHLIDMTESIGYGLIVSISTLEHVGVDEPEKDPQKIIGVMESLKHHLAPGGDIIISFPITYNPVLDDYILRDFSWNKAVFRVENKNVVKTRAYDTVIAHYHKEEK